MNFILCFLFDYNSSGLNVTMLFFFAAIIAVGFDTYAPFISSVSIDAVACIHWCKGLYIASASIFCAGRLTRWAATDEFFEFLTYMVSLDHLKKMCRFETKEIRVYNMKNIMLQAHETASTNKNAQNNRTRTLFTSIVLTVES